MALLRDVLRDIAFSVIFAISAVYVVQYIWWILNGHP